MNGNFSRNRGNIFTFDLRIVKIVEIIKDDNVVTIAEQFFDKMRSDETGTSSDENSHGVRLATDAVVSEAESIPTDRHRCPISAAFILMCVSSVLICGSNEIGST